MNISEIDLKSSEFQPMDDYLLIKTQELDPVVKSNSGIVIEIKRSSLERPCSGTVIASGKNEMGIVNGDFVIYPNTDGIDVKMNDGTFTLLRIKSVIGKKV